MTRRERNRHRRPQPSQHHHQHQHAKPETPEECDLFVEQVMHAAWHHIGGALDLSHDNQLAVAMGFVRWGVYTVLGLDQTDIGRTPEEVKERASNRYLRSREMAALVLLQIADSANGVSEPAVDDVRWMRLAMSDLKKHHGEHQHEGCAACAGLTELVESAGRIRDQLHAGKETAKLDMDAIRASLQRTHAAVLHRLRMFSVPEVMAQLAKDEVEATLIEEGLARPLAVLARWWATKDGDPIGSPDITPEQRAALRDFAEYQLEGQFTEET